MTPRLSIVCPECNRSFEMKTARLPEALGTTVGPPQTGSR
jgi:hypothetical protein